ncbi:MAG: SMC-Scp complex subunit ScpB [Bdellovibrionales bacterium]|nr:SMC-Scp complex subunit ScpB [Bdellovibrionales bacterium]
MSRKSKKSKKQTEEIIVDEAVVETTGTAEAAPAGASAEGDLMEMAEVEGLNLEFAEDEVDSDNEGPDDLAMSEEEHVEGEVSPADESEDNLEMAEDEEEAPAEGNLADTELAGFESAEIEDVEHLTAEQIRSVVESILFSTDKALSIAVIKQAFKGTNAKSKDIREALTFLNEEYAGSARGFSLEEVGGGFQLRTKADNMKYLRQSVKARPFKLSGPALEVMSIVAYKQPVTKAQMDEIRGVESGHLLRALMEKHLVTFGERSDLPGKPMFYETTRKFLEIFGLRNLQELPSLAEIDQLIPEGIGEVEDKETLSDLTGQLSNEVGKSYSEAEDELLKITDELTTISTSSDFFEQEKQRMREKRDQERAQSLREALLVGEAVEDKDRKWLERYERSLVEQEAASEEVAFVTEGVEAAESEAVAVIETAEAVVEEEDDRPLEV